MLLTQLRCSVKFVGVVAGIALSVTSVMGQAVHELRAIDPLRFERLDASAQLPMPEDLVHVVIDQATRELVNLLDSADYNVRESATASLITSVADNLQLYAVLAREALTAEQRCRVLHALTHRLVDMPRGAVGIRMQFRQLDFAAPGEIQVIDVIAGLPAERVLRPGDRITAVDGRPLMSERDFQFAVQTKRPGDEVRLTVKRFQVKGDDAGVAEQALRLDGLQPRLELVEPPAGTPVEVMDVKIVLGSTELLNRVSDQPAMPSVVETMRRSEASMARAQYGPVTHRVPLTAGTVVDFGPGADDMDVAQVDRQPEIVQLMREIRDASKQGWNENLRLWEQRLAFLRAMSSDMNLPSPERARLRRVADRYAEIIGR